MTFFSTRIRECYLFVRCTRSIKKVERPSHLSHLGMEAFSGLPRVVSGRMARLGVGYIEMGRKDT